jgi:hypothetical protein
MVRLHLTDAALAQMEELGLDQDAVRTAIQAGMKLQRSEHRWLARHRGIEVELHAVGFDYTVLGLRREAEWPRRPADHPYLGQGGVG